MQWWKRFRGSRGYGVHSPLAFRIVKNVVRPPRGQIYYGEETLENAGGSRAAVSRARLLLRFVAELQPATVWTSPKLPESLIEAIRLAGCVVRIYDGALFPSEIAKADMVVVCNYRLKKADLAAAMAPGKALAAFDLRPEAMKAIEKAMKSGVILDGDGSLIAVNTADGALHSYPVRRF